MRKLLSLFILFASISISGCQGSKPITLGEKVVTQINLSDFESFGLVNPDTTAAFTDNAHIGVFINAIESSRKIDGILDVAYAHNDFNIIFMDGSMKGYHLWLYEESGMIMEVNDTHIGYTLTKDSVNALAKLIKASQPPKLEVTYGKRDIKTVRGSYGWNNIQSDSPIPPELLKNTTPLTIVPTATEPQGILKVSFSDKPKKLMANLWRSKECAQYNTGFEKIILPKEKGIYVLELIGEWEQGHASYSFIVEVLSAQEVKEIKYAAWNAWNGFSDVYKKNIIEDYDNAIIESVKYGNKESVSVRFGFDKNKQPASLTVYVDPKNKKVLGAGESN